MADPEVKDLVAMVVERSNAWMTYWTVFVTVSGTVVTLIANDKIIPADRTEASVFTGIAFLFFATANLVALDRVREQRDAINAYVKTCLGNKHGLLGFVAKSEPPKVWLLYVFHLLIDMIVIVLIWRWPLLLQFGAK